jgi:phosphoribosylformimino-5-aminoimidazole carboxamide ribotide isomerase
MLILPAIDLLDGKCVRLTQGEYDQSQVYDSDPANVARRFADEGADFIHVVDLDGAKAGYPVNRSSIEAIVRATSVAVQVGGGVRSLATARDLLELGVRRVILGTSLIARREESTQIFAELGSRAVAGIDARDGYVAVSGWTEGSSVSAVDLARWVEQNGGQRIILTDIATDGMLTGPNFDLLSHMMAAVNLPVIASGGVSSLQDLNDLAKMRPAPEGAIVGKALYEGRFSLRAATASMRLYEEDGDRKA